MSLYDECLAEVKAKVSSSARANGKVSSSVSKSDLEKMTLSLLNDPEHVTPVYQVSTKDTTGTGKPVSVDTQPALRYRKSLEPMLVKLGVDKNDAKAVETLAFDREHAASLMNLATVVMKDYMDAGRKVAFPVTTDKEARMEIYATTAPERVAVGNRFSKEPSDSMSVTAERRIVKAKNTVPYWLKSSKPKED